MELSVFVSSFLSRIARDICLSHRVHLGKPSSHYHRQARQITASNFPSSVQYKEKYLDLSGFTLKTSSESFEVRPHLPRCIIHGSYSTISITSTG